MHLRLQHQLALQLYDFLVKHKLRLEQERIPIGVVEHALAQQRKA